MVCGPASSPCPASSLRIRVMSPAVSGLIADRDVFGRRDRGSNAASPSSRQRSSSVQTQERATP